MLNEQAQSSLRRRLRTCVVFHVFHALLKNNKTLLLLREMKFDEDIASCGAPPGVLGLVRQAPGVLPPLLVLRTSRLKLGGIRCLRIVNGIMFAIVEERTYHYRR